MVAALDRAVHNLEVSDDTAERVEYRVENERLQRSLLVAHWVRNLLNNSVQYLFNAFAGLTRSTDNILAIAANQVDNLIFHLIGHGAGHINLIDYRDNLQVMVDGHIEIRDGLCLYTLCGIHHQQRTLAGSDRTAHLVRKVDVSRSVNQVQYVFLSLVSVFHLDSVTLNRNTTFTLQVHIVEHLSLGHLYSLSVLQQSVSQSRFAVIDVGDDAEISYMIHCRFYALDCKITKKLSEIT